MDHWDIALLDVQPHQPEVLRSDDETRVIAINLPAGEALSEHQVYERAWLVVAAGQIEVEGAGETITGGAGLVVHFDPKERHEVRAREASRLILLLSPWPGEGHPSRRGEAAAAS
jgi:quercetin dioxygenase-like cupin family protein